MKINIPENCIIIAGVCYELIADGTEDCAGCVFKDENKAGCEYEAPCINLFSEYSGVFKEVSPIIND